jgi:hypothetical protein
MGNLSDFTNDLTGAEIKAAYEAEADTNAYTDSEKTKLSTVPEGTTLTSLYNIDQTRIPTGFSATGQTVTNDSAGDQFTKFVIAENPIPVGQWYWEVHVADAPATVDGFVGIVDATNIGEFDGSVGFFDDGIAYREDGTVNVNRNAGLGGDTSIPWSAGDVLRFTFDSDTDTFQIGINGTAPQTWDFTQTSFADQPYIAVNAGQNTSSLTIVTDVQQQVYAAPSGFEPLEDLLVAMTGSRIKELYEAEADTNVFDDAAVSKLAGIEANATADQTGAEIEALLDAYFGDNSWRTNVDPPASSTFLTSTAPGGNTGESYNAAGTVFTVSEERRLTEVELVRSGTVAAQDVSLYVAEVNPTFPNAITVELLDVGVETASGITGNHTFTLTTPIILETGKTYTILFVRTDATVTDNIDVGRVNSAAPTDSDGFITVSRSARLRDLDPNVADGVGWSNTVSVSVNITTESTAPVFAMTGAEIVTSLDAELSGSGWRGTFVNEFDQNRIPTGWSATGNQAQNDSAGNQFALFAPILDPLPAGKWYWEITYTGGLPDNSYVGLTPAANLDDYNTTSAGTGLYQPGIGWQSGGSLGLDSGVTAAALPTWTQDDVLRFAYDTATGELWVGVNGTAPATDGAADVTEILTNPHITVGFRDNGLSATVTADPTLLTYSPPTGFSALPVANGPTYTQTEKNKLAGVEDNATADQTGAEIVSAIDTELGGSGWQSTTVDVVSNVATNTILGRTTAGSGDSEELTPAQVRDLLNVDETGIVPITTLGYLDTVDLALTDAGRIFEVDEGSSSYTIIRVPDDATLDLPIGFTFTVVKLTDAAPGYDPEIAALNGNVSINGSAGGGANVVGAAYSAVTVYKSAANSWIAFGSIA